MRGVTWSAIERFSLIGMQFVIQLVLARLLTPTDYGIVGMLAVFLAISQTFIDCGFTNALIQNQQRTERDFATSFSMPPSPFFLRPPLCRYSATTREEADAPRNEFTEEDREDDADDDEPSLFWRR